MKYQYLVFLSCLLLVNSIKPNVYFWESNRDGERSCCLFIGGADICNPYVPCTRHAYSDLNGIYDYISRILQVDKGSGKTFSYQKILSHAQDFIKSALSSSTMSMYYRYDERRSVKFYHEIQETSKSAEKPVDKSVKSTSATAATSTDKKPDDFILAYLVKLGLARYL